MTQPFVQYITQLGELSTQYSPHTITLHGDLNQVPYYNSTWRPQPGPIPIFLASIPVLPASSPMCEQSDILTSPTYSSRQSFFPMCELPLWLTPLALTHLTPPVRAASLGQPHSSSRQSSIVSHTHCLDEELSPLLPNCKAPVT